MHIKKGRIPQAFKNGENHKLSKYTWNQIREIRKKYLLRLVSCRELSRQYGMHSSEIWKIVNNKIWIE
jgi:hypothetical protein